MSDYKAARVAMVDCQVRPSDVTRYPIIEAMLTIPREQFVPSASRDVAYMGEHIHFSPDRVLLDPRVMGKMLDAVAITGDELVLDIGCGHGYSSAVIGWMAEAVIAVEPDEAMANEAMRMLSEQEIGNVVVENMSLDGGAPEHGPYDAIVIQGGIEALPDAIEAQLKDGGRIAAIFMDGAIGQCCLGRKTPTGISWRRVFDATAPVLPGFVAEKAFEF